MQVKLTHYMLPAQIRKKKRSKNVDHSTPGDCHFVLLKADTNGGHPPALGHGDSNEQRHAHAGAGRGVRLRVSRRKGLHQLLLLFRRLPLRSLAARQVAHPHRQDRLVCTHLFPHCICALQPGLLGLLSLSLSWGVYAALAYGPFHFTYALLQQVTFKGNLYEVPTFSSNLFVVVVVVVALH